MLETLILMWSFIRTIRDLLKDPRTRSIVLLAGLLLFGGTLFYRHVEGWSWLDSLYFSVVTLATIGYGDFAPQTDLGKFFTIFYIIVGFGVVATFIRLVAQRRYGTQHRHKDNDDDDEQPKKPDNPTL